MIFFRRTPTLAEYLERNYLLYRQLTPHSAANIRRSLGNFAVWLGHDPTLADLSDELASRWVMHLEEIHSAKTAHNKRSDLMALWSDAYAWDKSGLVQQPRRVRRVRVPDPEPESWSEEEVAALVLAARRICGRFSFGPPRRDYLEAIVRTAWETGLRRGDLWALRLEHIAPDGTIQKTQSKR